MWDKLKMPQNPVITLSKNSIVMQAPQSYFLTCYQSAAASIVPKPSSSDLEAVFNHKDAMAIVVIIPTRYPGCVIYSSLNIVKIITLGT